MKRRLKEEIRAMRKEYISTGDQALDFIQFRMIAANRRKIDFVFDVEDNRLVEKWVLEELFEYCKINNRPVVESVELFLKKMDRFATSKNEGRYIFSIAYDIVMDVYDHILSGKIY